MSNANDILEYHNANFEAWTEPTHKGHHLAYIKAVTPGEAHAMGIIISSEIKLPPDLTFYALHSADGTTLSITDNWAAAYRTAIEHDLVLLSVH